MLSHPSRCVSPRRRAHKHPHRTPPMLPVQRICPASRRCHPNSIGGRKPQANHPASRMTAVGGSPPRLRRYFVVDARPAAESSCISVIASVRSRSVLPWPPCLEVGRFGTFSVEERRPLETTCQSPAAATFGTPPFLPTAPLPPPPTLLRRRLYRTGRLPSSHRRSVPHLRRRPPRPLRPPSQQRLPLPVPPR